MHRYIIPFFIAGFLFADTVPAQASTGLRVYIAGESSTVEPALDWAGWGVFILVDDPARADVLLLNGEIPDAGLVRARLAEGAGLVLVLGSKISSAEFTEATGVEATLQEADDPVHPVELDVPGEPLYQQIEWGQSPPVRERDRVLTPVSSVQPLLSAAEDGGWLIWSLPGGKTFIVNIFLGKEDNPEFREWEYYNYLIYQLVVRAGGREPLGFAEYPGAVIPRGSEKDALWFALAVFAAAGLSVFFVVRRLRSTPPAE